MKILFVTLVVICGWNLIASPTDDLTSPSPRTREAAAKILRATYKPPPQTNWDSLLAIIKPGDTKTNIEAILRARGIKPGLGGAASQLLPVDYKLNEAWTLRCLYFRQDPYRGNESLYDRYVFFYPEWRPVAVPTNFTGIWIEYYINGQKCLETEYKNGLRYGDRTCYDFKDGRIVYIEHYNPKTKKAEPPKVFQR